jgi:hypothetical protein
MILHPFSGKFRLRKLVDKASAINPRHEKRKGPVTVAFFE